MVSSGLRMGGGMFAGGIRNHGAIRDGTVSLPGLFLANDPDTGFYRIGADNLGLAIGGVKVWDYAAGVQGIYIAGANATSQELAGYKARGTVASPTVITTGDDLLRIAGYGYAGATNGYVKAAEILLESTGTISDASTGRVPGRIVFRTGTNAAPSVLTEAMAINEAQWVGIGASSPLSLLHVGSDTTAYQDSNVVRLANNNSEVLGVVGTSTVSNINFYVNGAAIRIGVVQALRVGTAGGALVFFSKPDSAGAIAERMRIAADGNVGIGTSSFGTSAAGVFSIANGTAPTSGPADTVQFYSTDIAAGHTEPSFFCEGTQVLATAQADSASSVRVKMRINGTEVTLLAI